MSAAMPLTGASTASSSAQSEMAMKYPPSEFSLKYAKVRYGMVYMAMKYPPSEFSLKYAKVRYDTVHIVWYGMV